MMRLLRSSVFPSIAMLASCAGLNGAPEPDDADMQSAVMAYMLGPKSTVIDQGSLFLSGDSGFRQRVAVKKIACTPAEDQPGQRCDFVLSQCTTSETTCDLTPGNVAARFVLADGKWQMISDGANPIPKAASMADGLNMTLF